ncbi:MAG: DUF4870 domain-containing protein [bacterium]
MNTKLGVSENILAAIGYIIPIVALIAFFIETENNFVRFHALQSILFSLIILALITIFSSFLCFVGMIPQVGGTLSCLCTIPIFILALAIIPFIIFLAWKSYNHEYYKIPFLGEHVERIVFKYH